MERPSFTSEAPRDYEAEQREYKEVAREALTALFSDVLDREELEERLAVIDDIIFVNDKELVDYDSQAADAVDSVGLITYEVGDSAVKRRPVVSIEQPRGEIQHTLMHELVHLMTPPAVFLSDVMKHPEDQTFVDYVGGYRYERLRRDATVDATLLSIKEHNSRMIFWEAVTDFLADEAGVLTIDEMNSDDFYFSGYIERHWIFYLVEQCPDSEGMLQALKDAYVHGTEDPVRWFLAKQVGDVIEGDKMYDEMLTVMGRPYEDAERIDDWAAIVNVYFS